MSDERLEKQFVDTAFGRIAYLEAGPTTAPPVLLVHGIPTSGFLWRKVMRFWQRDFHCLAPDLMGLGDTDVDPDKAEFHMEAQAEMLLSFMSALGHEQFAVVCHDQGGAAAQLIAARQPKRLSCLVLTDCVCYDNWPVPAIARLQSLARIPWLADRLTGAGLMEWLEKSTPLGSFRKGVHDPKSLTDAAIAEYLRPLRQSARSRKRFLRFLLAGHPRYSMVAVDGLKRFDKPTKIVWAADDYFISPSWGGQLQEDIPGAGDMSLVPFCGHFWQEERPAEFASIIGDFLAEHLLAGAGRAIENHLPAGDLHPGCSEESCAEGGCKPQAPASPRAAASSDRPN